MKAIFNRHELISRVLRPMGLENDINFRQEMAACTDRQLFAHLSGNKEFTKYRVVRKGFYTTI